jgi:hypothetical protein
MRRLNRGRAATDAEATPDDPAASRPVAAATDAQQGGAAVPPDGDEATRQLDVDATAIQTTVQEPLPGGDLPAGVDPEELAAAPATSAGRTRLRRRLRYLRATRELLLRDLGGFVHEAQHSENGLDGHRSLVEVKSRRLATLDLEVRALESQLAVVHGQTVLRQPGIGGTCAQCGELHGSEARFCSRCGAPLAGRAARPAPVTRTGQTAAPAVVSPPVDEGPKASTASLWGRPKRPAPAQGPAPAPASAASGDATIVSGEQTVAAAPSSSDPRPTPPNSSDPKPADEKPVVTSGDPLGPPRPPMAQRAAPPTPGTDAGDNGRQGESGSEPA